MLLPPHPPTLLFRKWQYLSWKRNVAKLKSCHARSASPFWRCCGKVPCSCLASDTRGCSPSTTSWRSQSRLAHTTPLPLYIPSSILGTTACIRTYSVCAVYTALENQEGSLVKSQQKNSHVIFKTIKESCPSNPSAVISLVILPCFNTTRRKHPFRSSTLVESLVPSFRSRFLVQITHCTMPSLM